jgi:mercuric ion transport protein
MHEASQFRATASAQSPTRPRNAGGTTSITRSPHAANTASTARPPNAASAPSTIRPPDPPNTPTDQRTAQPPSSTPALATAAIAALLASSCCLLPLALVSLGLTGAWLGTLRILQPYSPLFTTVAIAALVLAARKLFRPTTPVCTANTPIHRASFWLIATLTLLLLVSPLVAPWFY